MRELFKGLKFLFLTLFAYLFQACAMQYLAIDGVTASLPFCTLAVFTVSLGKKYTFCASCIIGILMECMLGNVPAMYAIAFPVIGMLGAQAFADRSERQREKRLERSMNVKKKGLPALIARLQAVEIPPLVRIPLCAMLMDLIWHAVMCIYMYLIGVEISWLHFTRLFSAVCYTGALTAVVMLPMRWMFGLNRRKKKKKQQEDDEEEYTPRTARYEETEEDTQEEEEPSQSTEAEYDDEYLYPEEGDW